MLIAELFRNNVLVFETVYDLLNDSENNQRVYMMRIAQLLTFVEVHKSRQGIIYLKSFFFEKNIELAGELATTAAKNPTLYDQKLKWIQSSNEHKSRAVQYIRQFFQSIENNRDLQPIPTDTPRLPQKRVGITNPKFKL